MFGKVKLVRNSIKSKFTYNGREIAFDGESEWSFGIDYARNVVIFGVDNSSSSPTDNRKNSFLVLGEGPTFDINRSNDTAEEDLALTLVKQTQNFA